LNSPAPCLLSPGYLVLSLRYREFPRQGAQAAGKKRRPSFDALRPIELPCFGILRTHFLARQGNQQEVHRFLRLRTALGLEECSVHAIKEWVFLVDMHHYRCALPDWRIEGPVLVVDVV